VVRVASGAQRRGWKGEELGLEEARTGGLEMGKESPRACGWQADVAREGLARPWAVAVGPSYAA
jgi:hypothetical protein